MSERYIEFTQQGKLLEAQRIKDRTLNDLELLKEISLSNKGMLGKIAVNKWFDTWYQGVVVMANRLKLYVNRPLKMQS